MIKMIDMIDMIDMVKILYLVFGVFLILLIIVLFNRKSLWKSEFSTTNLINEREIALFDCDLVLGEEKQKAKKSFSIKINYIFSLIFAIPLFIFGSDMLINAVIRQNDIFVSLATGGIFFLGGFMLVKNLIIFCYKRLIMLNAELNIYKVEVFVADRHTVYHRDSDYADYETYYITIKDKNNLGVRKWYEISKKDSNRSEFVLYYFKFKDKVFTSLVAKE